MPPHPPSPPKLRCGSGGAKVRHAGEVSGERELITTVPLAKSPEFAAAGGRTLDSWFPGVSVAHTKWFATSVTLSLGSRVFERVALLGIGRGHQSARRSPIPSSVRRTYTICHGTRTAGRGGRILPDGGPSTTSSSATQLLLFKVCR